MKLLIFFVDKFIYETNHKSLDFVEEFSLKNEIDNAVIGFIHVEQKDEENSSDVETKLVKNLKWAARKNDTNKIVLHSFNHLSESKASPKFTQDLFNRVEQRLNNSDYQTSQTPFGYFLNIDMKAPGTPLARLFKEF